MLFSPMHDNILVRPDNQETKSPGGILIPENAQKDSKFGTVCACKANYINEVSGLQISIDLEEGDRVMFDPHLARNVKVDGQDMLLVRYSNILGTI